MSFFLKKDINSRLKRRILGEIDLIFIFSHLIFWIWGGLHLIYRVYEVCTVYCVVTERHTIHAKHILASFSWNINILLFKHCAILFIRMRGENNNLKKSHMWIIMGGGLTIVQCFHACVHTCMHVSLSMHTHTCTCIRVHIYILM